LIQVKARIDRPAQFSAMTAITFIAIVIALTLALVLGAEAQVTSRH